MVISSPARSTSRPIQRSGSSKAFAAKTPMSSASTIWKGLSGSSGCGSIPPRLGSLMYSQFCIKKTGRNTVLGTPLPRTCSSTSHLLSKCGMPVSLCAAADRAVDVVVDASSLRGVSEQNTLPDFTLDAGLPGLLDGEHPVDAIEHPLDGRALSPRASRDLG